MPVLTKETFLKAEDPKNRDAMLFDMFMSISDRLEEYNKMKEDINVFKAQVSLVKKLFAIATIAYTAAVAWLEFH